MGNEQFNEAEVDIILYSKYKDMVSNTFNYPQVLLQLLRNIAYDAGILLFSERGY